MKNSEKILVIFIATFVLIINIHPAALCSERLKIAMQGNDSYLQRSSEASNLCIQAKSFADAKNYDQAQILYEKACRLDPSNYSSFAHISLGIALVNLGKVDEAITELGKALQYDPGSALANSTLATILCNKANQLTRDKKYDEAKTVFQQAAALSTLPASISAGIHTNYGALLAKTGKMDESVAQHKIALSYDPQNEEAIYNIGCCYESIGDLEQAKYYFTKYINDYPAGTYRNQLLVTLNTLNHRKKLVDNDRDSTDYFRNVIADGIQIWTKNKMPIKVFIPTEGNIPGFRKSFREILISGFDEWTKVAGNYLSWKLISNEQEADIICRLTSNQKDLDMYNGTEQGKTTTSFITTKDGESVINHALMRLCIVNAIYGEVYSDKAFTNLCLHEVGHALGLNGHSPNRNDIMFASVDGELDPPDKLSARDIATINHLYATYQTKLDQTN